MPLRNRTGARSFFVLGFVKRRRFYTWMRISAKQPLQRSKIMNEEVPSSLITSYHYLRYILLGFFFYVSHKYIELCCPSQPSPMTALTPIKILLAILYGIIGITLLFADIRNYILYKLLYHKFYENDSTQRKSLDSNFAILISMLKRRGILEKVQDPIVDNIKKLADTLKDKPRGVINYIRKLWLNWLLFWAVQPGPVSLCIMFLYITGIIFVIIIGFYLAH